MKAKAPEKIEPQTTRLEYVALLILLQLVYRIEGMTLDSNFDVILE